MSNVADISNQRAHFGVNSYTVPYNKAFLKIAACVPVVGIAVQYFAMRSIEKCSDLNDNYAQRLTIYSKYRQCGSVRLISNVGLIFAAHAFFPPAIPVVLPIAAVDLGLTLLYLNCRHLRNSRLG